MNSKIWVSVWTVIGLLVFGYRLTLADFLDRTVLFNGYRFISAENYSYSSLELGGGYRVVSTANYSVSALMSVYLLSNNSGVTRLFEPNLALEGEYYFANWQGVRPFVSVGAAVVPRVNNIPFGLEFGGGFYWKFRDRWPLKFKIDQFFWGENRRDFRLLLQAEFLFSDPKQALPAIVESYEDVDGDQVPDYIDTDLKTPINVVVDSSGRALDSDGDRVPDYADQCPDTPVGVVVDSEGCPKDTDKDGIADELDQCPKTPLNAPVDRVGCPIDTDGDGIKDYLDLCPGTPKGVKVDQNGCIPDRDQDSVADVRDNCPDTPYGVSVDSVGCPVDTDEDGVPDYQDACPSTDQKAVVDLNGCQIGIKNYILFDVNSAAVANRYYTVLSEIATLMLKYPKIKVELQGNADQTGSDVYNQKLSLKRANSVLTILTQKFKIDPDRIKTIGFGFHNPLVKGNEKNDISINRRVEIRILFGEEK